MFARLNEDSLLRLSSKQRLSLRVVPLDATENESEWETIIDFTKIKKGGVSAKELLKRLKKLGTKN